MNDKDKNLIAGVRAAIAVHEDFDQIPLLVTDAKRLLRLATNPQQDSLMAAYRELVRMSPDTSHVVCEHCGGDGTVAMEDHTEDCDYCYGTGVERVRFKWLSAVLNCA